MRDACQRASIGSFCHRKVIRPDLRARFAPGRAVSRPNDEVANDLGVASVVWRDHDGIDLAGNHLFDHADLLDKIGLVVSDGLATDTNSVTVAVFTAAQAVQRLIAIVDQSHVAHPRPLTADLEEALASINRGNSISAINQLQAFQTKVRVQVAPRNPVLADRPIQGAQREIDAPSSGGAAQFAVRLHSLERQPDGNMQFDLSHKAAGSLTSAGPMARDCGKAVRARWWPAAAENRPWRRAGRPGFCGRRDSQACV